MKLTRRNFNLGSALVLASAAYPADASEPVKDIMAMKPGEFTWHPERAPKGAVAVVVSLPQQRVHVYRNGIRIGVSTCSTGKPGHETPTGVFVVLQKDKNHKSSTYNDAPMPNMNRLTWSGIALHAGNLPGYPASHGCVRLPMAFSEKLFGVTHLGTPVILAGSHSDPYELTHPGMVLGTGAEGELENAVAGLGKKKHPSDWAEAESYPITSVIASSASGQIELIENNRVVKTSPLTINGAGPLHNNVYVLREASGDGSGLSWMGLTHHGDEKGLFGGQISLLRLKASADFSSTLHARLHPGMTFITTDAPLTPDSRSGKDFVVMTTEA